MNTRRVVLAVALVGTLSLVGVIYSQTRKSKSDTITVTTGNHQINVDGTPTCVDVDSQIGNVGETISWKINASGVTNFHVIFPKDSPFSNGQNYFDNTNSSSQALNPPKNGLAQAYEYVISVDGGKTCDPHVIVIGGKDGK